MTYIINKVAPAHPHRFFISSNEPVLNKDSDEDNDPEYQYLVKLSIDKRNNKISEADVDPDTMEKESAFSDTSVTANYYYNQREDAMASLDSSAWVF